MNELVDIPGMFIVDPDRHYTEWGIWEIYTGADGTGIFVPNPDDSVRDWNRGFYRVASVDYTTGLSVLVPWTIDITDGVKTEDVILGTGPGYQSESFRVYIDKRTLPYTLEIDRRIHFYSSQATYIKVFKGVDTSEESGEVISAFYNSSGDLIGENIPLEVVAMLDINNKAIKAPVSGFTTKQLMDGEVVTVVAYSTSGTAICFAKFLVDNTSLVRRPSDQLLYIESIRLQSSFFSPSDPTLLEFPINITVASVPLIGVVRYSNGTEVQIPITLNQSGKFTLMGLDDYVPTIFGQINDLVLRYIPDNTEYVYNQYSAYNGAMVEYYKVKTIAAINSYSVKLYAYPTWVNPVVGYKLQYYLYNLDRSEFYRLPEGIVEINGNNDGFDGLDFVKVQKLSLSVDLNRVDPSYNTYRHVQTIDILLKSPGTINTETNWSVGFTSGNTLHYGNNLSAKIKFINTNQWTLNIASNYTSFEPWLRDVYYKTEPLFDSRREMMAPRPTHFVVITRTRRTEYSIDKWNQDLQIYYDLQEGNTIYIEWIKRTLTNDLQLGVSGLTCHLITT